MSSLSRVVAERVARCPFSVAHEYAEDFFRQAAARGAEVGVRLRDVVPTLGGRLRQPVQLVSGRRPDEAESGRAHDELEICWTAGTRFFPDFRGTLRLRIASVDETRLTLEGTYHPPFGAAGLVFDRLIGRRIARATMRDLLERLAGAMERREEAYRGPASADDGSGSTA
ncbi:MAG: hypothetical protein JWM87_4639 [Candidatus Eremiobacteraeota bacterium]|nr:hypothetical protein [Candidatus Eremiobacteraeota bacterium]